MNKYQYKQFAATRLMYPPVRYSPDSTHIGYMTSATGQLNLWSVPSGGVWPGS
ncbi:MAG: hypothetical protein HXY40_13240 [Chloroflexi bacterium]|nr:hypothetical protein [Chloroflexota bacterium]